MPIDPPVPVTSGTINPADPDAHGQAALLLVESLIHGLVAGSVLTIRQAVNIVDIAADVKVEVADSIGERQETMRHSLALLLNIGASLRHEIGE